jgi:hypothetical protein
MVSKITDIKGSDQKWVKGKNPSSEDDSGFWAQKNLVDKGLDKVISRKFFLLVITLLLLILPPIWGQTLITESTFQLVAMMYLAVQGITDAAHQVALVLSAWKGGNIPALPAPSSSSIEQVVRETIGSISPEEHAEGSEEESESNEPEQG